ncbi:MAG: hypothetical protein ABSB15_07955 [Bryobacteraceae bacterium]|jgi:hypothetical protein
MRQGFPESLDAARLTACATSGLGEFAPVAELQAAECTVVEGEANKAEKTAQGVSAHAFYPVSPGKPGEIARAAVGAFDISPEDHEERAAPDILVAAAMRATKDGVKEDFLHKASPLPGIMMSALRTDRHRSFLI